METLRTSYISGNGTFKPKLEKAKEIPSQKSSYIFLYFGK